MDKIPLSILIHVLSHDSLTLSTEDSLCFYICSRISDDPEYHELLQFVRFEYLSSDCMSKFLSLLPFDTDRRLWAAISPRLFSPLALVEVRCPFKADKSLDGIISYLTGKYGGNVHDKGIVTIYAKRTFPAFAMLQSNDTNDDPSYPARNLADLTSEAYFWPGNRFGNSVYWDFHDMRVIPTHYTIKSSLPKSWVVESSLDDETWTQIDEQKDNDDLKEKPHIASFAVSKSVECRFIRLIQTGDNHYDNDAFSLCAFEVFGTLIE
jgi:hypothetical protein